MPSFRLLPAFTVAVVVFTIAPSLEGADKTAWPREIKTEEGRILVYQPQPDGYEGNILSGRAAVSIKLKTKPEPVFGTAWFRTGVDVDREHRTAQYADVTIPKSRFPGEHTGERAETNVYHRAENRARTASTMDKLTRPQAKSAAGTSNNLYSDRSGNVYRRDGSGSWQTREGNSWKGSGNTGMNRDDTARQNGAQRTQGYRGDYGGGYRGGGGGPGGGRR